MKIFLNQMPQSSDKKTNFKQKKLHYHCTMTSKSETTVTETNKLFGIPT